MSKIKLGKFIEEISMGPFGSDIKVENFINEGMPVLNGSNLTSHKLVEDGFKYVSEEKGNSFGKAIARRGDIVITHRGTLGQVAYIPYDSKFEKYVISQSQFRVKFKKDIDPIYFSYLMKSKYGQAKLLSFKNHVGVPALAQATTNFKALELEIHELGTQQKIASVLSALDDKIELNNQINAELEAMAKLIYEYWFVQFDFPDKNGKPYKSSGGKMVWNKELKREIPEGWEVKNIFNCSNVQYGYPFRTEYFNEENGVPVVRIRDILYNTISNFSIEPNIDPKYKIETGDLLVGMDGNFHINFWSNPDCYLNQRVVKFGEVNISNMYLRFAIEPFIKLREKSVSRTTVGHLSDKDIKSIFIVVPSQEVLEKSNSLFKSSLAKMMKNRIQNQELASLRDWLLPMLMNGQVTVADAEELLEEKLGMVAEERGRYGDK